MPLILASASPRRRQLLAALGIPFTVDVADIDESRVGAESPEVHVRRLAEEKARAVAARHPSDVVLAADTIVVLDGRILGKPRDAEAARAMLRALRGRAHQVITAVAVALPQKPSHAKTQRVQRNQESRFQNDVSSDLDIATVVMRDYSDAEINAYIASGDPFDKAGAYAIQNPEFRPAARLEGCFAGVMGLPLAMAARLLTAAGLAPTPDWLRNCHAITGRCCQLPPNPLQPDLNH